MFVRPRTGKRGKDGICQDRFRDFGLFFPGKGPGFGGENAILPEPGAQIFARRLFQGFQDILKREGNPPGADEFCVGIGQRQVLAQRRDVTRKESGAALALEFHQQAGPLGRTGFLFEGHLSGVGNIQGVALEIHLAPGGVEVFESAGSRLVVTGGSQSHQPHPVGESLSQGRISPAQQQTSHGTAEDLRALGVVGQASQNHEAVIHESAILRSPHADLEGASEPSDRCEFERGGDPEVIGEDGPDALPVRGGFRGGFAERFDTAELRGFGLDPDGRQDHGWDAMGRAFGRGLGLVLAGQPAEPPLDQFLLRLFDIAGEGGLFVAGGDKRQEQLTRPTGDHPPLAVKERPRYGGARQLDKQVHLENVVGAQLTVKEQQGQGLAEGQGFQVDKTVQTVLGIEDRDFIRFGIGEIDAEFIADLIGGKDTGGQGPQVFPAVLHELSLILNALRHGAALAHEQQSAPLPHKPSDSRQFPGGIGQAFGVVGDDQHVVLGQAVELDRFQRDRQDVAV